MTSKMKRIVSVIIACVVIATMTIVIILIMPVRCLKVQPDNISINISVYSEESALDSFFSPAFIGQTYDYKIVVKEKGLFGSTLLKNHFTFKNDGAPIHDYNVSTELENNIVQIKISGSEMSDKIFEIQLD